MARAQVAPRVRQAETGHRALVVRRSILGMLVGLVVQFCVGVAVNLYSGIPAGSKGLGVGGAIGHALADGAPSLVVHVVLGLALILGALGVVVRSAGLRHWGAVGASVVGLLALIGAAFSGVGYVSNADPSSSLAMAVLTAVALLAYVAILYVLPTDSASPR